MLPALLLLAITTAHAATVQNNSIENSNINKSHESTSKENTSIDEIDKSKPKESTFNKSNTSDCECYDNIPYRRSAILTIKGLPTNLAFDSVKNDLHFTLIDVESLQNEEQQTKMQQYILRKGQPILLDHVNGQAAAYDEKKGVVYLATDDGLQTVDEAYRPRFHSFKNEDIVQLFKGKKNQMYAVVYPDNEVYKIDLDKNEKEKVPNLPCAYILAVDNDDNIYYECDKKVIQVLLKGFQEPIDFVGVPKNSAKALALDSNGRVILAANDGLYHLKPNNIIPKKLMNLDVIPSGIVINKKDIYLASNNIIYVYKPCV